MQDLMIDLETMGTLRDAPVCSVGAVFFNRHTGELGKKFYATIDLESAFKYGKASGGTIKWWLEQSEAARMQLVNGKHQIEDVLVKFFDYAQTHGDDVKPWSNGATFDIPILEYAFHRVLGRAPPWKFWNIRDCRTIKDLAASCGTGAKETKLIGTAHNALDDAVHQAKWVCAMHKALSVPDEIPF